MPGQLQFCLISATRLVSAADLFRMAPALEQNARACAEAWGLLAPTVDVIDAETKLPERYQPIVFVEDDKDPRDFLAIHYWDPVRGAPAARVYCDRASGLNTGRYSICEAASHEITEALVDPDLRYWVDHPDPERGERLGQEVAVEVADPVQTHYTIEAGGTPWRVSNFVTPAWFERRLFTDAAARTRFLAAGGRFDHRRELTMPGEVGPEGYVVLRRRTEQGWRTWSEARVSQTGADLGAARTDARRHPWSRTRARGAV